MKDCHGKPSGSTDAETLAMILDIFIFHFSSGLLSHVDLGDLQISMYYNKILTLRQIFSSNNLK